MTAYFDQKVHGLLCMVRIPALKGPADPKLDPIFSLVTAKSIWSRAKSIRSEPKIQGASK